MAVVEAEEVEEIEYGSFTEDQLYQTIVSELGAQRGDLEEAGDNYLDLAMETRDLGIVMRAVQFASANADINALMQLGLLWAEMNLTILNLIYPSPFNFWKTATIARRCLTWLV
ncbi:MAG: hypothetical protein Ct9H300mP22_1550 [Gammaproteobacteria bacterium]|nr:MAG: hypothetical protein Ct9H300mP22_1550 [Gammaproteobacteria bacterium]